MAFGFSPRHIQDFPGQNITTKRAFALAVEVAKKLKWEIGLLSESGFIAHTKFSMSSWSEEVRVKIDYHNINLRSECEGIQIIDWGKNRKNVAKFVKTYSEIRSDYSNEELDRIYLELEESFVSKNDDLIGRPYLSKKGEISGFLSIFQARPGYFVTPSLIGLNLLVFIFMAILGVSIWMPDVESLILWGANYKSATLDDEWWRLITNCFIHIGLLHLLMNLYALVYIGILLEPYLGKTRFFTAYILTGIAGSVASLYWNELTVSTGASGAIFGMYGTFLAMLTTNVIEKSARKGIFPSIFLFVLYSLISGLQEGEGVDNAAHVGGLVTGIVFGYLFYPSLRRPKNGLIKLATVILVSAVVLYPSFILLTTTSNDIGDYEKRMEKFASLEQQALNVFNRADLPTDDRIIEEIDTNGIARWQECISLIEGADTLDIPDKLRDANRKLLEYCELRIKSYETIRLSIVEETNEYEAQILELEEQIEQKIDELAK